MFSALVLRKGQSGARCLPQTCKPHSLGPGGEPGSRAHNQEQRQAALFSSTVKMLLAPDAWMPWAGGPRAWGLALALSCSCLGVDLLLCEMAEYGSTRLGSQESAIL